MAIIKFKINDPIYNSLLYLILGGYNQCKLYIEKIHKFKFDVIDEVIPYAELNTVTLIDGIKVYYLWMENFSFDRWAFSYLTHEINHFCIRIMFKVGIEIGDGKNEAYCYYAQYILFKILEILEKIFCYPNYKSCKEAINYMKDVANG